MFMQSSEKAAFECLATAGSPELQYIGSRKPSDLHPAQLLQGDDYYGRCRKQ